MGSKNRSSFLRPLKNKGFKEEIVTKIGVYDILKSTPLESNKSLHIMLALYSCFGHIVVANEILDGTDMIGEGLGKRQCTAYQT